MGEWPSEMVGNYNVNSYEFEGIHWQWTLKISLHRFSLLIINRWLIDITEDKQCARCLYQNLCRINIFLI